MNKTIVKMTQIKPKTLKETQLTWTTGEITDTPTITPHQSRYLIIAGRCATQRWIDLLTDRLVVKNTSVIT